jgi:cardiolipin synthase A/B
MVIYVPQRRPPAAARSWLLLILVVPWLGLLLYLMIGRAALPARRLALQQRVSEFIRRMVAGGNKTGDTTHAIPPAWQPVAGLIQTLGDLPVTTGNHCDLLSDYQSAITRLVTDIDAATQHVHLLYYIFSADRTATLVADAVIRAAGRGVSCRVLMDGTGSKRGIRQVAPRLQAAGVEVVTMLPVGLFRRNSARFDLRNHRKIAVIDGRIGYTGSQNLVNADFIKGLVYRELVVRVSGPVVRQLQTVLLADHFFETEKILDYNALMPIQEASGTTPAVVLPSGPGYPQANTMQVMVALVHAAQKRVVITTPYFIPTEPLLNALLTAALRGVAVQLIVSKQIDQFLVGLAQRSFYDQLLEGGVAISAYHACFLHAKHVSIDDEVAIIGSSNMDIRSFSLNAEISLVTFDRTVVDDLRRIEASYLAEAETLTLDTWRQRPAPLRILQNLARLTDSVL